MVFEESFATAALNNTRQLIEEEKVEVCPDELPDAVVDENIDVHFVLYLFASTVFKTYMEGCGLCMTIVVTS